MVGSPSKKQQRHVDSCLFHANPKGFMELPQLFLTKHLPLDHYPQNASCKVQISNQYPERYTPKVLSFTGTHFLLSSSCNTVMLATSIQANYWFKTIWEHLNIYTYIYIYLLNTWKLCLVRLSPLETLMLGKETNAGKSDGQAPGMVIELAMSGFV